MLSGVPSVEAPSETITVCEMVWSRRCFKHRSVNSQPSCVVITTSIEGIPCTIGFYELYWT